MHIGELIETGEYDGERVELHELWPKIHLVFGKDPPCCWIEEEHITPTEEEIEGCYTYAYVGQRTCPVDQIVVHGYRRIEEPSKE